MSIDNIKSLYAQVKVKSKAIKAVAEATGRSYNGVKNHWLSDSGGWSIPDDQVTTTVNVLQNVVKEQNTFKTD